MSASPIITRPISAFGGLAALLLAVSAAAQAPRVEKHFAVSGRPVVTVQNPVGRVQIKAWDKSEVKVVAQHVSSHVGVSTEQVGDRIEITSAALSSTTAGADDLTTNYEISVPTESELQLHTDSGNVTVDSVHGDMSFDTVTGDVSLQDVQGYMLIKSISGSLVCTRCSGHIDATSISGNFQLIQPVMDNVRLQTSSGNIFFDGAFADRGIYVMRNYSGNIEVRFSRTDSIDVRAASLYGTVVNEAPVVTDKHRLRASTLTPGISSSLFGSLNQGQAKVELSSFNGTIKILKRE